MTSHSRLSLSASEQIRESGRVHTLMCGQWSNDDTGWMITLSDLTLLLLCFLGLWYVKDHHRTAAAQAAKPPTQTAHAELSSVKVSPTSAQAADWNALRDEIEAYIAGAGMNEAVSIEAAPDEILISFKDAIPFDTGKADLKPRARPVIEQVATIALGRPALYLEVNGHTDDRPISTTEFPSNWELSSARASRVARYLIQKGVHPSRIGVHGFADHRPRVAQESLRGRSVNRRVEIRLMRTADSAAGHDLDTSSR